MSGAPLLIANLGAEEDRAADRLNGAAAAVAGLWQDLFDPPAFPWLVGVEASAWWNDDAARRAAAKAGFGLSGAPPDVARRVHDKAFALALAQEARLDPPTLRGLPQAWAPAQLLADDAADLIAAALAAWPNWAQESFTLKPRLGTSGRGRVAGTGGRVNDAMRGAFARLARAGGAILEPWLDRLADMSTQLHIGPNGSVTVLGTLEIAASRAGVPIGHRGECDPRGRTRTGLPEEEALREVAEVTGARAAAVGYRGPCGVDGFVFRSPENGQRLLRPLVEFNARFTAGTVAIGHLRRNLPQINKRLGIDPGRSYSFYIGHQAPPAGWPEDGQPDCLFIPLCPGGPASSAGLFVSPDKSVVDALFTPAASRRPRTPGS